MTLEWPTSFYHSIAHTLQLFFLVSIALKVANALANLRQQRQQHISLPNPLVRRSFGLFSQMDKDVHLLLITAHPSH